ncbi:hypothetical protein YC2023_020286 [Brassica napus]
MKAQVKPINLSCINEMIFSSLYAKRGTAELVQRSGFDRTASAFSSAPLDNPTADHQRRELVYLFRVVYMRYCFPCTGIEIVGLCLEASNIKQLEISFRNKVRSLPLESGAEGGFNPLGFLQVPGLDDIFTGDDDTWEAWLSVDPS